MTVQERPTMAAPETQACELVQCISVVVLPDPGAIARVIEPFAKLGLVPLSINSRLFAEAGQVSIDIQISGMSEEQGQRIANQIGTFPITLQVVTGRKYIVGALSEVESLPLEA